MSGNRTGNDIFYDISISQDSYKLSNEESHLMSENTLPKKCNMSNALCEFKTVIYFTCGIFILLNLFNSIIGHHYYDIVCFNDTNVTNTTYTTNNLSIWLMTGSANNLLFITSFYCLIYITQGNCSSSSSFSIKSTCAILFCYLVMTLISIIFGCIIFTDTHTNCNNNLFVWYGLFVTSILGIVGSIISLIIAFMIFTLYFFICMMIYGFHGK